MNKFYLKNGELSAYSFLCGYVQKSEFINDRFAIKVQMYLEHCIYNVEFKVYNIVKPFIGCLGLETNEMYNSEKSFDFENTLSLTDARANYRKAIKQAKKMIYENK